MWQKVSLGEIVKNLDSRRIPLNSSQRAKKSSQKLYPYIGANNIKEYISEYIFDEKILCVAEDGGNWAQGQVCAVIYEGKTWVNNHAHVLVENGKAKLEYLRYFLNEADLTKYITGATRGKLTRNALDSIQVPLPPIDQQIEIASILGKAESLINQRKESVRLLDEYLKSTFLDMFGDPFTNSRNFKVVSLEEVASKGKNAIVDGPFGSSLNNSDYFETGIPIIRINNIRDQGFYDNEFKFISEEKYQELIRSKVIHRDILIARVGNTIGKSCIFNKTYKALLSTTGVAKVTIDAKIAEVKFISAQMRLPQYIKYVWNQAEGGGQPYLNLKKIKAFKLLLPPIKLQKEFVEIFEKGEIIKAQFGSSLEELQNLYSSLSQKAFKGELQFKPETIVIPLRTDEKEEDYFKKRKALACYIINQSLDDEKFGDTKFEKLLFLSDYAVVKRNFGQHYYQKVAGPYDNTFTNTFYIQIENSKLFKRKRGDGQTTFLAGANHDKSFNANEYFSEEELRRVNSLIKIFRKSDYEQPEIIATLYAVWNNRIIRQQEITDELLKEEFLKWDPQKVKYKDRLGKALSWMRAQSIVPDGWGSIVDPPQASKTKTKSQN